jgi:hypothetical protein
MIQKNFIYCFIILFSKPILSGFNKSTTYAKGKHINIIISEGKIVRAEILDDDFKLTGNYNVDNDKEVIFHPEKSGFILCRKVPEQQQKQKDSI